MIVEYFVDQDLLDKQVDDQGMVIDPCPVWKVYAKVRFPNGNEEVYEYIRENWMLQIDAIAMTPFDPTSPDWKKIS